MEFVNAAHGLYVGVVQGIYLLEQQARWLVVDALRDTPEAINRVKVPPEVVQKVCCQLLLFGLPTDNIQLQLIEMNVTTFDGYLSVVAPQLYNLHNHPARWANTRLKAAK